MYLLAYLVVLNRYLRVTVITVFGWEWVKGFLSRGLRLFPTLYPCGDIDPEPAVTSQKKAEKLFEREFRIGTSSY